MAERNSKRQKLEEDVDAKLEAFVSVQEQINEQDNELAEKMLELTREYAAKKAPLYTQRQSVSEAIPNFWSKVVRSLFALSYVRTRSCSHNSAACVATH